MSDSVMIPAMDGTGFGGAGMGAGFIGGLILGNIQINLQSQLQQQTLYLVDQLKPATTTTAGA